MLIYFNDFAFIYSSWKSRPIGKDPDAGKDWGQEEKGMTEDEMVGWHYQLDGHEFGWTPGDGEGQGSLACCDLWGRKESDTTEQLNWTEAKRETFSEEPMFELRCLLMYKLIKIDC